MWNYVYYMAYLNKLDPNDENGIETYVREMINSSSLEWIPSRSSHLLETHGKTGPIRNQRDAFRTDLLRVNT